MTRLRANRPTRSNAAYFVHPGEAGAVLIGYRFPARPSLSWHTSYGHSHPHKALSSRRGESSSVAPKASLFVFPNKPHASGFPVTGGANGGGKLIVLHIRRLPQLFTALDSSSWLAGTAKNHPSPSLEEGLEATYQSEGTAGQSLVLPTQACRHSEKGFFFLPFLSYLLPFRGMAQNACDLGSVVFRLWRM